MPQLETGTFASQLFWLFVSFCILFCVCYYWFVPKIERIQMLRARKINRSFEKAKLCQEQTLFLIKDYEAIIEEAKEKAAQIIFQIHKKNQEERLKAEQNMQEWIQSELKNAEEKLAAQRQLNAQEMEEAVQGLSKALLEKINQDREDLDLKTLIEKEVLNVL